MQASETLSRNLQSVLVDLIELHIQGKQAHWSIVGKNFRDLHLQLDEIVAAVRAFSDEMAERMRALEAMPDGRSETVTKTTNLPGFPEGEIDTATAVGLITERLDATVGNIRSVHDQVEEEDPTTADVLHTFIAKLEQFSWMVSAENRKPRKAVSKSSPHKTHKS